MALSLALDLVGGPVFDGLSASRQNRDDLDEIKVMVQKILQVIDHPELKGLLNKLGGSMETSTSTSTSTLSSASASGSNTEVGVTQVSTVEGTKDVEETMISVRNTEAGVKPIEESGVVQNQLETKGWCATSKPPSLTLGLDR
ncbi:hypothetical protein M0R45_001431 [Rubus argutus]|uniref:Uncharacterized protein n=1 Tax=Rubus argutus TaxID=59490 RepID=A0AAW1VHI3_RUBAR